MLPDSSRRRTPGGLFFLLVRQSADVSRRDKVYIFPQLFPQKKPRAATGDNAAAAPASVAWTDDTYHALTQQLQQEPGRATTVKITVIGRPGAAVEQGQAVVLALVSEKVPAVPKGLRSRPPARATPSSSPVNSGARSPRPWPPMRRMWPSLRATPPSMRAWRASPSMPPAPRRNACRRPNAP